MNAAIQPARTATSIAIVGLGNIGSQVVPLLAGIPALTRAILIDQDRYTVSNLGHQGISGRHLDQLKVKVQARTLAARAPHVAVDAYACRVEAMPLGRLRHCVILACVDSRSARQSINRVAFRLGIPWIDAALDRAGSVRARAYVPDAGDCLECSWAEQDYSLLEQVAPCNATPSAVPATAAPIELGSIAAGLQVAVLRRLLSAEYDHARDELAHQQWFYDLSGHGWIGRYARNPQCRFDHGSLAITPLARSARAITLREIFALAGADAGHAAFSIDGHTIARRLRCTACRNVKHVGGRVLGRIKAGACRRCGGTLMPAAIDTVDSLSLNDAGEWLDRTLASFGLVDGDVVSLAGRHTAAHYELGSTTTEVR